MFVFFTYKRLQGIIYKLSFVVERTVGSNIDENCW